MVIVRNYLLMLIILLATAHEVLSQSVPFPKTPDPGTIGPWGYEEVSTNWDTSPYLPFKYEGIAFRIMPPNGITYDSDLDTWDFGSGEKYPILIHFHGRPQNGTDNNKPLKQSGKFHRDAVLSGEFPGFLLYAQNGTPDDVKGILDKLIEDGYPIDPTRIYAHGLSRGASWCWGFGQGYPEMVAAFFPMSGINPLDYSGLTYTPIRLAQGANDTNPTPSASWSQKEQIDAQGGNFEYILYDGVGHGTWNLSYALDDYFTWFLSHRLNKIYAKFDYYEVCPEDPIDVVLGVKPGNDGYEWAKDGVVLVGADTSELVVDAFGDYTARLNINGEWTDWSEPLTVGERLPTQTPPITVAELVSYVLPDPNGNTSINITLPDGYESYGWYKDGSQVSTEQTISAEFGEYTALVQERYGCSSEFSEPFNIIQNTGLDVPLAPSNLTVQTISKVELKVSWVDNAVDETFTELYRRTSLSDPYELVALLDSDMTVFEDSSLAPGVEYYYSARTINTNGASGLSAEFSGTTDSDTESPTVPTYLEVIAVSSNQVTLEWQESTDNVGVDRYEIYQDGVLTISTIETIKEVYNLTADQIYRFTVVAVDLSGNKSPHSERIVVSATRSGLDYKYYEGNWSLLPDFNTLTPVSVGMSDDIDISIRLQEDNFAFYWEGNINIPVAGEYTFETYSDDGSKFYIGSYDEANLVVDNDGAHGAIYEAGTYNFPTAGAYPIVATFFERTGGDHMELYWSNTAHGIGTRELIPETAYIGAIELPDETVLEPNNFTATAISTSEITLNWVDASDNEINFQIFRSIDDQDYSPIALVAGNTTSYQDIGLDPSTQYFYKIVALGQYSTSATVTEVNPIHSMPLDNSISDYSGVGVLSSTVGIVGFDETTKKVGSHAVSFENIDSYIVLDNGDEYVHDEFTERSVAFWLYTASTVGIQDVYDEGGGTNGYAIRINDGSIELGITDNHNLEVISAALATNEWVHIATSFDSGMIKLYVNGSLVGQNDDVGYEEVSRHTDPGGLGATVTNNVFKSVNNNFAGLVDDFFVFDEALTLEEVQNLIDRASNGTTASAITLDLPQPTDPLTGFTAVLQEDLSISLNWDQSDVYGYQVLRSEGSADNFGLIAYLSSSMNMHIDSTASSHSTYYYTVRSRIATGYSLNSDTIMVSIENTAPVIETSIPDYNMYFEEEIALEISLFDKDGDDLTIEGVDFPSFVSVVAQGSGALLTIDPESSDFGIYEDLMIRVDDGFGGVVNALFDLEVVSNYAPSIVVDAAYTLSAGQSLLVSITAEDVNGDNLIWSHGTLPSFVTPTINGAMLDLDLNPDANSAGGVYTIDLRVDDDNSTVPLYTESQITITVIPYDPNHSIYVNFGSDEQDVSPWNSFLDFPNDGTSLSNLINDQGFTTTTSLELVTRWGGSSVSGGLYSTLYDDQVSTSYFWTKEDTEVMKLTGLDSESTYNFDFFASRNKSDDRTTIFQINDQSVSLQAAANTSSIVEIDDITPDINGDIIIEVSNGSGSTYGYLNAMVIEVVSQTGIAPIVPTSLVGVLDEDVTLTWTDNSLNETGFEIYRSETDNTNFQLLTTVSDNVISYIDTDLPIADVYYQIRAVNTYGSSDFSNEVEVLYENRLPVITLETALVLTAAEDYTLAINVVDPEGDAFTVEVLGTPSFGGMLEIVDTDNWQVVLSPSIYEVGSYVMSVEVTDVFNNVISLPVSIEVVSTIYETILVNFGAKTTLDASAPWNNLLGKSAGLNISDLMDVEGASTGFGIALVTTWNSGTDKGAITGDDSGVYPDIVMENFLADNGDELDTIKLTGLDINKVYDLNFFASREAISTRITTYSSNGESVDLNVADNTSTTAEIKGIVPSASGEIFFTVDKGSSSYKYLNALEITVYEEPLFPTAPSGFKAQAISKTEIGLSWEDNSTNETGFELLISATGLEGSWTVLETLGSDVTTYAHTGLANDTEYFYKLRAFNTVSPSYYTDVVSESTYNYLVYINIGASTHEASLPWNNFVTTDGPYEHDLLENLINESGNDTGISIEVIPNETFTTFAGANRSTTGGTATGDDSGVYPDVVMESYFWIEGLEVASLELSNLALNQEFDFAFFASRDRTGDLVCEYTIGNQSASINATGNTTDVALLKGVIADIDGNLQVDVISEDSWGYIGSIVIKSSSLSASAMSSRAESLEEEVTFMSGLEDGISVFPNPFHNHISLKVIGAYSSEKLHTRMYNQLGQVVYFDEQELEEGSNSINLATDQLNSGMYFLQVIQDGKAVKTFKLIK